MGEGGLEGDRQSGEGLEQPVLRDSGSQLPDVPPQLADDGGGLVGKGDGSSAGSIPFRRDSRRAGERTVDQVSRFHAPVKLGFESIRPKSGKELRGGPGIGGNERNLYPRRIPAPDLQPVQAVQEGVEFTVFRQGLRVHIGDAAGPGQIDDPLYIVQDIVVQTPEKIPDQDQASVHRLEVRCGKGAGLLVQKRLFRREKCAHSRRKILQTPRFFPIEKNPPEGLLPLQAKKSPLHLFQG